MKLESHGNTENKMSSGFWQVYYEKGMRKEMRMCPRFLVWITRELLELKVWSCGQKSGWAHYCHPQQHTAHGIHVEYSEITE